MSHTFSLDNNRLFLVALALTITPLWLVSYLPMVDLPQHAAQITSLQELWAGNPVFDKEFEINWFTPYVVTYVLFFVLSTIVSVPLASKLLVTVAVISIPLMTGALLRELGGDVRLRWLAIPGAISFAFYWGFLSFMCAVPLGMFFVLRTIQYERDPGVRNGSILAVLSVTLFFTHVLVLGVASLISLAYLVAARYRHPKALVFLSIPYMAALPVIFVWGMLTYSGETHVQNAPLIFGEISQRLFYFLTAPTGVDFFRPVPTTIVALILYLSPILIGAEPTRDPRRWAMFGTVLIVFLIFPSNAFRTAFLFERFGIFLLPFWVMVWDRPGQVRKYVDLIPMTAVVLIASLNIMRFSAFNVEVSHFDRVVKTIDEGSRVAFVVGKRSSMHFYFPVYLHHGVWAQSTRKSVVDFNFSYFYPTVVRFRQGRQTGINEQFSWYPFNFSWEEYGGDAYDYFLFHADQDLSAELFRERSAMLPQIAQSGRWWLYRNDARSAE